MPTLSSPLSWPRAFTTRVWTSKCWINNITLSHRMVYKPLGDVRWCLHRKSVRSKPSQSWRALFRCFGCQESLTIDGAVDQKCVVPLDQDICNWHPFDGFYWFVVLSSERGPVNNSCTILGPPFLAWLLLLRLSVQQAAEDCSYDITDTRSCSEVWIASGRHGDYILRCWANHPCHVDYGASTAGLNQTAVKSGTIPPLHCGLVPSTKYILFSR
jgi:hypothetical protein